MLAEALRRRGSWRFLVFFLQDLHTWIEDSCLDGQVRCGSCFGFDLVSPAASSSSPNAADPVTHRPLMGSDQCAGCWAEGEGVVVETKVQVLDVGGIEEGEAVFMLDLRSASPRIVALAFE